MTLCKQDGIFIERPEPEPPVDGCVYAMTVDIGVIYQPYYGVYCRGDTVMYMLYIENVGTCELTDVVLTDETGGSEFTIPVLAPGEVQEFYSEYIVEPTDIENGEVYLFVTADSNETHTQTHKSAPVDSPNMTFYDYIYANDRDQWTWTVGETVELFADVENTGNIDFKYAKIRLYVDEDDGYVEEEISVMHPMEEFTLNLNYTLTQEDVTRGYFTAHLHITGFDAVSEHYDLSYPWIFSR